MNSGKVLLACTMATLLGVAGCHRDDDDDADRASRAVTTAPVDLPPAEASTGLAGNTSTATPPATVLAYDQLDQNHDGGLTPDELHGDDPLKQNFKDVDSNGDGKLSADEVSAYRAGASNPPMASPGS